MTNPEHTAQPDLTDDARPMRLVLVAEPHRLAREALVAAIDAARGLAAIDGSTADRQALARADAVVVAASVLRAGCHRLLGERQGNGAPSPVVILADNGPVTPAVDNRGIVVISRQTPLAALLDCLRTPGGVPADAVDAGWEATSVATDPPLTMRERQVLGLLASGLSPTEVARGLAITTNTTRDHIKAIRAKLDRPTIMAAVLEAIRRGLLHVDRA